MWLGPGRHLDRSFSCGIVFHEATLESLAAIASAPLNTISDVIAAFSAIEEFLPAGDGLKWFNWLYLQVTKAVDGSVGTGQWNNPEWLTRLDVVFAGLYLDSLAKPAPKCWQVLLDARHDLRLARIQFALAGMNAHIDHDLSIAVTQTCREFAIAPVHLSPQYQDYCRVNDLLDAIVEAAKKELLVGLLGDPLPCLQLVENLAAAWGLRGTREVAWTNAELLWHAQSIPGLAERFLDSLDTTAALAGRGLLAPVGI